MLRYLFPIETMYIRNGVKRKIRIVNDKKYRSLNSRVKQSLKWICRNILSRSNCDEIEVEGKSDIQFYDLEKYFLEVKSLFFFEQKGILERFEKINREHCETISTSSQKFYLGFGTGRELEIIQKKSVFNPLSKDSSSILMYDNNFLDEIKLFSDICSRVDNATRQLSKITEIGRKIAVIDISQHPFIDPLRAWHCIKELWTENYNYKEKIDGVSLFCHNIAQRPNDIVSIALTPCVSDVRMKSPVFHQPFTVVGWNVMSIPTHALFKHQKKSNISITRRGNLKVKRTIYAPFWKSTNFLMQKNRRDFNAH
ncbi:hypothetical protein LCGC14_1056390 [marine sediment metagenome]|uniref:Uncharacterized protein n=1 Tax=marine sediment metagenome TaxID=412755 RepID=A0A0F9Q5F1_9ZZZZ